MIARILSSVSLVLAATIFSACGKSGPLTLVAKNSDAAALSKPGTDGAPRAEAAPSSATFKICVKKISLEDESGEDHGNGSSDDGATEAERNEIEFSVGSVDLTTIASGDVTLGTIPEAPVGFKISKVKIKLKKFGSCSHSIEYGTKHTDADVEFRFRFTPAVELESGDTLDVYFSAIASLINSTTNIDHGDFRAEIQQVQATARRR